MSAKSSEAAPKRPYRKRRRAEQERETRLRITEAAVALHGRVGPANTTVSALAEAAGVQRATVYRHFPDEEALLQACSAHWAKQHPPPDPERWRAIADPGRRLRQALGELYGYYGDAEQMLANVIRDAEEVAAMRAPAEARLRYLRAAEEVLSEPFGQGDHARRRATVGLALDFRVWRLLARERGLTAGEVVELMARTVECAGAPSRAPQEATEPGADDAA